MWKFRAHLFDRNGERIELTRGPPPKFIDRSGKLGWYVKECMNIDVSKRYSNCLTIVGGDFY